MRVLLTNDDSHVSPMLEPAMAWAESLGEVTVALPAAEQSGTGKAISCFRRLTLDEFELHGRTVYSIDGTPADCVNIGLCHLVRAKPDVVVSGINLGVNQGLEYVLSSGTIGACLEANLAGIPGIALSQELAPEVMRKYRSTGEIPVMALDVLASQTAAVLKRVQEEILGTAAFCETPVTWNINLPAQVRPGWQLAHRRTGLSRYVSRFRRSGKHLEWSPGDASADPDHDTETAALRAGDVSVARLDLRRLCEDGRAGTG